MSTNKTHVSPDSSTPRCAVDNGSVNTKTTSSEALPQCAEVLATSEHLISLDDRITRVEERRPADLELHAIENEP